MDTSVFYVYKGNPVTIVRVEGETIRIRYIDRMYDDREDEVAETELVPLTDKLAAKYIRHIGEVIGECNMRIHAFNECLRYM